MTYQSPSEPQFMVLGGALQSRNPLGLGSQGRGLLQLSISNDPLSVSSWKNGLNLPTGSSEAEQVQSGALPPCQTPCQPSFIEDAFSNPSLV